MDTKRFPGTANVASFRKRLEEKLTKLPDYHAFVIGDDNALRFALAERDRLFAGRPIIFHGINDLDTAKSLDTDPSITGVVEAASVLATLDVIKELSAPTGDIFIIVDETPSAQAVIKPFLSNVSVQEEYRLKIVSMRDHSYEELAEKLHALPDGTAALFVSASRDRTGRALRLKDFMNFVTVESSVPIYTLWHDNLGLGVLGGKLVDPYQQGRASGLMVAEILAGRSVSDIPVLDKSPNVYAFDWNIMQRFGIDVDRLPEGSVVINSPKGLWEEYRMLIISVLSVIASLAILSFVLLFYTARLKRLQADLRASELKFRDYSESSSDYFWEMDSNLRFSYFSDRFASVTGVPDDDLLGKSREESGAPPGVSSETWEAHLEILHSHGEFRDFIHARRKLDGDVVWLAVNGKPIFDKNGNFQGYRGTGTDITRQKQAEEALTESEAKFRRLVEGSLQGVVVHRDWKILFANPAYAEILGYTSPEELIGTNFPKQLAAPRQRLQLCERSARRTLGEAVEKHYESEAVLRRDGSRVWLDCLVSVIDWEDEPAIQVAVVDISERKQAEEELRLSEERFRSLIENAQDIITILDSDGVIRYQSPSIKRVLGYEFEELIGTSVFDLVHPDDLSKVVNIFRYGIENPGMPQSATFRFRHRDGSWRSLDAVGTNQLDNPHLAGIVVNSRDVTERREMDERLRQSQKMEAVGQLTGGVAHDFNNLMAIMIGNTELLEERLGEDGETKECLEAIKEAIDRGSSLTDRLLAFSRQQVLSPVATDVSDLIGGLHDMLLRTLGETVVLKVESTPGLWLATIDPHQFENALVNLAINARDAMPRGGTLVIETANVTLDETYAEQYDEVTPGDCVMVAVSDTGTGMPPEVLENVFEPFFTSKEVGEGSGLGLSMVYGFVKQSNGHITIYSEVDHGTTIKIYMPRSQEAAAKTVAKDVALEFAQGSERILVVEDDPGVRKGAVAILRSHGYEVVEAGDGNEAIDHLKTGQSFDLLFTDVVLPGGMNGVEIAEQAKRLQPSIKVLYTSGYAENAVVHNGQLDPGVTVVTKPYRRAELLGKVRTLLDSGDG